VHGDLVVVVREDRSRVIVEPDLHTTTDKGSGLLTCSQACNLLVGTLARAVRSSPARVADKLFPGCFLPVRWMGPAALLCRASGRLSSPVPPPEGPLGSQGRRCCGQAARLAPPQGLVGAARQRRSTAPPGREVTRRQQARARPSAREANTIRG
jgi:hypothetical protein